jgi:hypothetical protein
MDVFGDLMYEHGVPENFHADNGPEIVAASSPHCQMGQSCVVECMR